MAIFVLNIQEFYYDAFVILRWEELNPKCIKNHPKLYCTYDPDGHVRDIIVTDDSTTKEMLMNGYHNIKLLDKRIS